MHLTFYVFGQKSWISWQADLLWPIKTYSWEIRHFQFISNVVTRSKFPEGKQDTEIESKISWAVWIQVPGATAIDGLRTMQEMSHHWWLWKFTHNLWECIFVVQSKVQFKLVWNAGVLSRGRSIARTGSSCQKTGPLQISFKEEL